MLSCGLLCFRHLFSRSKRGCNGGTPCEQCIRRDQPCTYSQRRKSGPRGRPIRQPQPALSPASTTQKIAGARKSRRKRLATAPRAPVARADSSTTPSPSMAPSKGAEALADASPPSRTASISSSPTDTSQSEGWDSDVVSVDQQSQTDEGVNVAVLTAEAVRAAATAAVSEDQVNPSQVLSAPASHSDAPIATKAVQAATSPTVKASQARPTMPTSVTSTSSLPTVVEKILRRPVASSSGAPAAAPPSLQQSPEDPLVTWPAQRSLTLETTSSGMVAAAAKSQAPNRIVAGCSNSVVLHQISSQPWEISPLAGAPPATAVPPIPQHQHQQRAVGFAVTSDAATPATMPPVLSAPPSSAPFGGALLTHSSFSEEFKDFSTITELEECPSWGGGMVPSLTRDVSLARAVEALGGESIGLPDGSGFSPASVW